MLALDWCPEFQVWPPPMVSGGGPASSLSEEDEDDEDELEDELEDDDELELATTFARLRARAPPFGASLQPLRFIVARGRRVVDPQARRRTLRAMRCDDRLLALPCDAMRAAPLSCAMRCAIDASSCLVLQHGNSI